ncbi:MAG: LysR family transcriptional regulator [Betaproteobacteria bacterium]|nr:LysR family transcriptional regulator [Betaproteobacteria bacterium]
MQLFDRNGHRARPTDTGVALMREASQLLSLMADAATRAQRIARGLESELRVAVESLVPIDRLLPLIGRFYDAVQGVRLTLLAESLTGCWDALRASRADLIIGAPEYSMPSGVMNVKHLGDVDWLLCAPPNHPLTLMPTPVPVAEIAKYRTVLITDSTRDLPARSMGLRAGSDALTVSTYESKLKAQQAGIGIGFLTPSSARPLIDMGQLVEVIVAEQRPPSRLCYAWQHKQAGTALNWFLEQLESQELRKSLLP